MTTEHSLRLTFDSSRIVAYLDGQLVANVIDNNFSSGVVGLGSGWHPSWFSNFSVEFNQDQMQQKELLMPIF